MFGINMLKSHEKRVRQVLCIFRARMIYDDMDMEFVFDSHLWIQCHIHIITLPNTIFVRFFHTFC